MKRTLLTLVVLLAVMVSANAQKLVKNQPKVNAKELKASLNPNDVSFLAVPERVDGIIPQGGVQKAKRPSRVASLPRRDEAVTDTVQYFAIAQSFHSNYTFNYEGGDIYSYNIGLAINGTKATITNLFDMYHQSEGSWSRSYDYPVDGVYDADAKTITIPTTTTGVKCGDYGGWYDVMLVAGEVSENGTMTPDDELVFDVTTDEDGTIISLTAEQNFAAKYDWGTIRVYKSFSANMPKANEANLKSFVESVDFGECFVNTDAERTVTLFNTGGMDAEFAMELEAEDDAFTSTAMTGTIPAHSAFELPFAFNAAKAGSYEGIATITYDNGNGESTLVIDLAGSAKDYPDYSAVVKNGDFNITTGIDFPFEMSTLEDGTPVAQSGMHGKYGSSWLNLEFTVPEGKTATVSWKGVSNNATPNYWYYVAGGYFIDTLDGAVVSVYGSNDDISGNHEFAPGKHFIRFQYDSNYYTGNEDNKLYVYDIDYTEMTLAADSAAILTPEVNLGKDVLAAGGTSTKNGVITLKNYGANDLVVNKVTTDNEEFTSDISGLTGVATMQEINIPVTMETKTSGDKKATYTIETSAGTFTAVVTATVSDMPDFMSLVTEGAEYITSFEVNPESPFVIKDGKAVNANAGDNSVAETAWFKMNITVPEGKLAYVSWDGVSYGRPIVDGSWDYYYSSYGYFEMQHPMNSGTLSVYGNDVDASSNYVETYSDGYWADFLACVPGDHYYKFAWYHNGDGTVPEGDCMEISNIKIHVIDFLADNVELETPEVTFADSYVGPQRYTTATVTLRNTGSNTLSVGDIEGDAPFYGIETSETAQFNKTVDVTLWFYPSEKGSFDGDVTITTSAGDVTVKCHGVAKNAADEGYVYLGDFEDDAYGWTVEDRDGDGETWDLGYNLWGDRSEYCHSGNQCLASVSYSNYLGSITPDNWTFSPIITIPEDGAQLSYYVAAFSPYSWEEHYSLYVQPYDSETFSTDEVLKNDPLISETLEEAQGALDGWALRQFDLNDYAGKQVVLCFRHHDCTGQYILRLDDVNVMRNGITDAISTIGKNTSDSSTEYFTTDGRQISKLANGINIVRSHKEDGSVVVRKVLK